MRSAAATASSMVRAGSPAGTGKPWRGKSCFPWYSSRSIGGRGLYSTFIIGVHPPPARRHKLYMPLPAKTTFVTFDVYGTLIDWESGIWDAFAAEAARDGFTIERDEVIPLFHEIARQIEGGSYELYAEVLRRTAVEISKRLGWPLEPFGFPARFRAALGALQGGAAPAREAREEVQARPDLEHRRQAPRPDASS